MHVFLRRVSALAMVIALTLATVGIGACASPQSTDAPGNDAAGNATQPAADEIPPPSSRPLRPFPLSQGQPVPLQRTEPDDGAVVAETPRAIQLWFLIGDYDAEHSWMELHAASGTKELGSIQLVGRRSLKAEIRDALPDGDYVANWWAADDDGHGFKGTTKFTVKRAR